MTARGAKNWWIQVQTKACKWENWGGFDFVFSLFPLKPLFLVLFLPRFLSLSLGLKLSVFRSEASYHFISVERRSKYYYKRGRGGDDLRDLYNNVERTKAYWPPMLSYVETRILSPSRLLSLSPSSGSYRSLFIYLPIKSSCSLSVHMLTSLGKTLRSCRGHLIGFQYCC